MGSYQHLEVSKGWMSSGWGQAVFSGAQQKDKRQWTLTERQEVPSEHEEKNSVRMTEHRNQLSRVSFSEDIQNPPGCFSVHSTPRNLLSKGGVGVGNLQRSVVILCFMKGRGMIKKGNFNKSVMFCNTIHKQH